MEPQILGKPISNFSRALLIALGQEAAVPVFHVTSIKRSVVDQAQILTTKHVVRNAAANYKNPDVVKIIDQARAIYKKNVGTPDLTGAVAYVANGILNLKGGPESASRHLIASPFVEVFDVAHYSLTGKVRKDWLTQTQATNLLTACRRRYGFPIQKLGISSELRPSGQYEIKDEQCFHFEVLQPVMDETSHYMNTA